MVVYVVHVSAAEIYDATVNNVPAGSCGFITYGVGDDVHLSFKAKHPNGFARFKFAVVRGSSGPVTKACAPANPDSAAWANAPLVTITPVNGFNRDASGLMFSFSVSFQFRCAAPQWRPPPRAALVSCCLWLQGKSLRQCRGIQSG